MKLGKRTEGGATKSGKATSTMSSTSSQSDQSAPKRSVSSKVSHSQSFKAVAETNEQTDKSQQKSPTANARSPGPPAVLVQQASVEDNNKSGQSNYQATIVTSQTTVTKSTTKSQSKSSDTEDVRDSYTTSSLKQRAISQQDIIKAALTSDSFSREYERQINKQASTQGPNELASNKEENITVFSSSSKRDKRHVQPTVTGDKAIGDYTQTTTTIVTKREQRPQDTKTTNSSAAEDRGFAIKTQEEGKTSHRQTPDVIDTENTTWTLKVDTDAGSQLSTASSKRRVPFERIHNQRGVVNIDLGETEVDETDQEVRNVTDQLRINVQDDRYNRPNSGAGGLLVINKTSQGHSPVATSHTSTLHSQQRELPEDKVVYHIHRKERGASPHPGGGVTHHRHEEYNRHRHLSPPPAPGYFRPVDSLQGSRAVSRSNSSIHSGRHSTLNRSGVVNLVPLSIDVGQQQATELRTYPSGQPSPYNMSSPAVTSPPRQFDTSQMRATSTLNRQNANDNNTGSREVLNSTSDTSGERDVNMNIKQMPQSPRYLAGEYNNQGRTPIRKSHSSRHVSNVSYTSGEMPMFDTLDGTTGKYRVQKVMDRRRAANELSLPMDMHPDIAFKKQKFYSVSRETQNRRNGAIVSAAPELENANKTGENYNVTLKLNTSQLGGGADVTEREEREEYEEQVRMQRQQQREREERVEQMRLEQLKTERLLAERQERLRLQKVKAELQREEREEQMRLETLRLQRLREEDEERMRWRKSVRQGCLRKWRRGKSIRG